jgi:hypothetical protein
LPRALPPDSRGGVCSFVRPARRPIPSHPTAISLTTTTTSLPPTSLHFILSFTIIVYSPTHTTTHRDKAKPPLQPTRLALARSINAVILPRLPTATSVKITTTTATPTPLSSTICHAHIGLSPIVPCDRRLPCICTRAATSQSTSPIPRSCANIPHLSTLYPHAT